MEYPRLSSSAQPRTVCSPGLRLLAWLNVAIQATFPLALAFTPTIAGADEQHVLLSAQHTRVYTLGDGENAASVAKKFHLTLDQLRELNQLRTFAHGLNGLQRGDDVDIPMAEKGNKTAYMTSGDDAAGKKDDEQVQKVAGYASQTAGILSGGADAATSMARGMATSEVSGTVQQWLSHFGTARVELDADQHFSLKNSQFDLLMPLYDQGNNLVFTQGSLHRSDSRTQANLGTGLRHFTSTYMLGANLFGDYDLSRDHARTGAGVEYWRDFLRLSANGYLRLTGWKDSPDLTSYQERPANGWDIRAQGWLPSLPQLGGKLTYEQYYGKEVALFGVDNRQKDPRAITAGINYTPVPLITLGAEQRQGESGKNDSRLTLEMKYQIGTPWRSQVDPGAVAAMRTLTGSRYDLVERNNNIVLEYRKKETLKLHTADLITGHGGEQKSLGVSVTSTYGLARIDWDAAALTAAGGKIVQNGTDYAVVLPPYRGSTQADNIYTLSGVAVDTRGNRSDRSDTQVTVQAPEVNQQTSTFTPVSSLLPADGKSVQVLTLTLRDANNQAVDRDINDITLKNSALKSAAVSAFSKKSAGVYSVTVTAGTDSETVTLTPSVSGMTLSPARVTISSTVPDAGQSVFTLSPQTIAANNTTTSMLTLVVKDAQGNALTGLKDGLTFLVKDSSGQVPAAGVITLSAITESSGTYTATLKGTTAGQYRVVPEYGGSAIGSLSATVTLTATTPDQAKSAIALDNTTYLSGADIQVTVTLKDAQGSAVVGASSSLTDTTVTVPNSILKTGSSWKDNGDGTYSATYTATTVGTGLQAAVKLPVWSGNARSAEYAITEPAELGSVIANGYTFDKDAGFPTTGFTGATFTLNLTTNAAANYRWTSDASWVTVSNGVVKFTGEGTGDRVTVTGTPVSGQGKTIRYTFRLNSWFISSGDYYMDYMDWYDAGTWCSSHSGYSQPTVAQMSLHSNYTQTGKRGLGALWNEWGNLGAYNAGFAQHIYSWMSEEPADHRFTRYMVHPYDGSIVWLSDTMREGVVCRKGL